MASSIEISFSASRLRSAPRSMSITVSPVRIGRDVAELQEYLSRAKLGIAEFTPLTSYFEYHAGFAGGQHPAFHRGRALRRVARPAPAGQRHPDPPPGRAAPVPGLGQRPVRARRGHLERVGG